MVTWKHIVAGGAALTVAAVILGFLMFANATTRPTVGAMPRAAAIVVLTGGAQRIGVAGRLLQNRQAGRLLISGVNRVVSRAKLRRLLGIDADLFTCCVDIDYAAQNTRGNAIETRRRRGVEDDDHDDRKTNSSADVHDDGIGHWLVHAGAG